MGNFDSALAAALAGQTERAYADEPLYGAGESLLATKLNPVGSSNTEFLLASALQGLGGGVMKGMGENFVADEMRDPYTSMLSSIDPESSYLKQIASPEWNPRTANMAILQALDDAQRKRDLKDKMILQAAEVEAYKAKEKAKAEISGESSKPLGDALTKDLASAGADLDALKNLASAFRMQGEGKSALGYAIDKYNPYGSGSWELFRQARMVAQKYARSMESGRMTDQDRSFYNDVILGGATASPRKVADLLDKIAVVSQDNLKNKAQNIATLKSPGGVGKFIDSIGGDNVTAATKQGQTQSGGRVVTAPDGKRILIK